MPLTLRRSKSAASAKLVLRRTAPANVDELVKANFSELEARVLGPHPQRRRPPDDRHLAEDSEAVLARVTSLGEDGATARELSRKLGIPWERVNRALWLLHSQGKLRHQWSACQDWRTHYALQEGRYHAAGIQAPPAASDVWRQNNQGFRPTVSKPRRGEEE